MAKILHQVLFPPQNKKDVHGLEQVQGRMLVCPGKDAGVSWDRACDPCGDVQELGLVNLPKDV